MLGNKEIMARNIRHYMTLFNKSRNEMCDALGVKYTTFTDWINANTYPRIDKIELMADYFGINKSDLIEESSNEDKPEISGLDLDFIKNYHQLDDQSQRLVDSLIELLRVKQPDSGKVLEMIGKLSAILHS